MRWTLVGPLHPYRGGIAHYGASLAEALAQSDEVSAVNFRHLYPSLLFPGRTQYDDSESPIAFPAPRLLSSTGPLSWRATADHIASTAPDAVIFQWWHPFFGPAYGAVARRLARLRPSCRSIFLCHNVLPHERSFVDTALGRIGLGSADAFLVHSSEDTRLLASLRPGALIRTHPHPRYEAFDQEPAPDRAAARELLGIGTDRRLLLFFGLVRRYKGLDLAIEAFARLDDPRYRLLAVGEFYDDRKTYENLIARLGIGDRVTLEDRYVANEEVPRYFSAADLVVLPYRSATQSGIAQIAATFVRPVLATRVGGLPDLIEDGVTGLLVPPDDPDALAEAITGFFEEGQSARMERAIAGSAERYSWSSLATALRDLAARES